MSTCEYQVVQRGTNGEDGLFTEVMCKFIKGKQQASGFPAKYRYIDDFFNAEKIRLDKSKIKFSGGLRLLNKTLANAIWGKFCQREKRGKTLFTKSVTKLHELLNDPNIQVQTITTIDSETLIIHYEHIDDDSDVLTTINVCCGAYTTAQARLKLYSYLEQLEGRVIYCDTDSIIYIQRPWELEIQTGTNLGDMTDELEKYGPGSYVRWSERLRV